MIPPSGILCMGMGEGAMMAKGGRGGNWRVMSDTVPLFNVVQVSRLS